MAATSSKLRLDVALPAAPPAPALLNPPAPPLAVWRRRQRAAARGARDRVAQRARCPGATRRTTGPVPARNHRSASRPHSPKNPYRSPSCRWLGHPHHQNAPHRSRGPRNRRSGAHSRRHAPRGIRRSGRAARTPGGPANAAVARRSIRTAARAPCDIGAAIDVGRSGRRAGPCGGRAGIATRGPVRRTVTPPPGTSTGPARTTDIVGAGQSDRGRARPPTVGVAPPPPLPPSAVLYPFNDAALVALAEASLKLRLDVALPAAPPAPLELYPPAPPLAVWRSVNVLWAPPLVAPVTALLKVLEAPAPPAAPPAPFPPEPPVCVAVDLTE